MSIVTWMVTIRLTWMVTVPPWSQWCGTRQPKHLVANLWVLPSMCSIFYDPEGSLDTQAYKHTLGYPYATTVAQTHFSVMLCVHCLTCYSVMRYKYLRGVGFVLLKNRLPHKRKLLELSSSSSSYIFHGVGPLVDPFWSHVSRSFFKGLPWFRLPVGECISLPWAIYFEAFYLHAVSSFSCIPVICPKLVLFLTPLQFVRAYQCWVTSDDGHWTCPKHVEYFIK